MTAYAVRGGVEGTTVASDGIGGTIGDSESGPPVGGAGRRQPVPCKVCTILIGEGYQETYPIPLPNGLGHVCWRCYESLRRQAHKRAAEADKRPATS